MNDRDAHVESDRILQDQSFELTVLRNKAQASLLDLECGQFGDVLAFEGHLASASRIQAHHGLQKFGTPCADQTVESDDLALTDFKRTVAHHLAAADMLCLEKHITLGKEIPGVVVRQFPADHHSDQVRFF